MVDNTYIFKKVKELLTCILNQVGRLISYIV